MIRGYNGYKILYKLVIIVQFYLKTADTFPNKEEVTSINFLSFIVIRGP